MPFAERTLHKVTTVTRDAGLKGVRRGIALDRNLLRYVIFSDKTLRAMAKNRPTDPAALRRCPGVGDHKLEAYGSAFLRAIREFTSS